MGKKKKAIVDAMKPKFLKQGAENGYDTKILEKIWADWEKFASYAFNKSHATCYSWVAYQTAYLKAHYPAEFMAALMTRRSSDIGEIKKLMEECKAMKVKTLGPDVNESYESFGVNKKGEIRFGLKAISGIGEGPAKAIVKEREANGPYKDIYDFACRVNLRDLNRKAFESLALSGAFDGFGLMREQYMAPNAKGEVFLDSLVRFAQQYQQDKKESANSLFGNMASNIAITYPPVPKAEPWSKLQLLDMEKRLVGIYLSAHPLDDYAIVLNHLCNTLCKEMGDRSMHEQLAERGDLTFGGIVTKVDKRFDKRGEPFGIVTIEDFEGAGDIAIFGEEWARWSGMLQEGYSVFVKARYGKRFPTSRMFTLTISSVEFLQSAKDKRIERFTINVPSDKIDDTVANDIETMVQSKKGPTELYFNITDESTNAHVVLRASKQRFEVTKDLVQYIEDNKSMSYTIN